MYSILEGGLCMAFLKNKWIILGINLLLSFIIFLLFSPQYTFMNYINYSFYIAAIYFFLFIFLFIVNGRFFDGLVFATRRFLQSRSKRKQRDLLQEMNEKKLPSQLISKASYRLIAFQGLTLMGIQLLLLTIYYIR